jgi:diguanylate cyclase
VQFVALGRGAGPPDWAGAGWLVACVLIASAALNPSMVEAGRRATPSSMVVSRARLRMYMLLTLLIPALTVTGALWHGSAGIPAHRLVVPLLASAAMSALLLLRVSQLAAVAQRRASELDERTVALGEALHEQEILQQELRHRAMHDPLTALGNRALLNERLAQSLRRIAPARLHGLYFLDLDGFKDINDTLGHPAGDELLIEVADRLRRAVTGGATLTRLGGDEFAIILVNSTMWELRSTADAVLVALRAPYRIAGQLRSLTTSIGLRVVSKPMRPTDALRDADIALYEAKAAGKNQIRVFTDAVGAAA